MTKTDWTVTDVVRFANSRHRLWEGKPTVSKVLTNRKFTNVFRVLDRGSQYLLGLMNTLHTPLDRLALSYLYRQINRPDTLAAVIAANEGYIPDAGNIFDPVWYDRVLRPVALARPGAFLSGAYLILVSPNDPRPIVDKMQHVFPKAQPWLEHVAGVSDLDVRVMLLQETPGVGPFLAMQIATDMGYTNGERDQENSFILPGPGARKGVGYLLGTGPANERTTRKFIQDFPVDRLPSLPWSNGRPASQMDIQNVFCEFSKYVRFAAKPVAPKATPYRRGGAFQTIIPPQFVLKP